MVVVGNMTDERSPVNLGHLITMGKSVIGPGGASPRDMAALLEEHRREAFVSIVTGEYSLAEADVVQRKLLGGGLRGRMVLRV